MTPKQIKLFIYAICIVPVMAVIFYFVSRTFGKTVGYFLPYGIYLLILFAGSFLFKVPKESSVKSFSTKSWIYYLVSFIPVVATFAVAFLPTLPHMRILLFVILIPYACLNGILEELFWRYTFSQVMGHRIITAYILPTVIFSCWHFALLLADGVSFHGGWPTLFGGAVTMGFIWGLTMFKTQNIKVVILAHVMVNFFAFSQLLYQNWFL